MQFAKVNEIYDLHTQFRRITVLKFHTPQDNVIGDHLGGFYAQYKRMMYGGMEVALVPATTLPLDPLQVTLESGEPGVDPRDILNPILSKNYHGEYIATDSLTQGLKNEAFGDKGLNIVAPTSGASGQSITDIEVPITDPPSGRNAEVVYGNLLMDRSWRKTHVQSPLSFRARPLVYPMQANFQIGSMATDDPFSSQSLGTANMGPYGAVAAQTVQGEASNTSREGGPMGMATGLFYANSGTLGRAWSGQQIFTSGLTPMKWFDTVQFIDGSMAPLTDTTQIDPVIKQQRMRIPKVYMHAVILPPAFKQNMYYRLIITHKLAFQGMRTLREISRDFLTNFVRSNDDFTSEIPTLEVEGGEIKSIATGVGQ